MLRSVKPGLFSTKTPSHRGRISWCLGVFVLITAVFGAAPPAQKTPPNIILIGVDTLRADRLECYGYERVRTPHVNRLAQDGVLFENTIAQVPLTLPSFCSIMTGTYPVFHGVRDFSYGFLAQEKTTLAEMLKTQGYVTSAFIAAFVLDARFGLSQGFDYYDGQFDLKEYEGIDPGTIERRGDQVVTSALQWLEANRDKPFFTWIHLYDPHHPFTPPEPYRSQYTGRPYDGEVAFVDALVGEILSFLQERGLYEDSLIVFTSDHGESLGEHGEENHGFFIYDASSKVPLVIKPPGPPGNSRKVPAQVRTIDILPTILQYLGIRPPEAVQGIGLRSLIEGKASRPSDPYAYSESYYAHSSFGWSPLRGLRTNQYKYILAPRPELYDLTKDPGERENIYARNRALANKFDKDLRRLEQVYGARDEQKRAEVDPAVIETLKSLGYVAFSESIRSGAAVDYSRLADPKDKIDLFNLYLEAQDLSQAGKQTAAIERLKRLIDLDPRVSIAVHTISNRYLQSGRPQEVVELNRKILTENPDSEAAWFNLGRAYKHLRQTDEAIEAYVKAIALNPGRGAAYHNLGVAYLEKKDFEKAVQALEQAVRLQPNLADPHANLGLAQFLRGNSQAAISSLQRAIELEPENSRAHEYLGNVYVRTGRRVEGEAELRRARELQEKQRRGP